ncbi:hypothetical protein BUL40_02930 [Croceivirga radicis]|uniref:Secretion system C-terminal sorting domain-containing protein n=1 Tax=Croceivirga radicis TaxID=1929488 RepID=A0A1V6LWF8_9FLAO|nr:T9SS type A sorting domain-containing protein [Croceivirga radicis]OQD44520.1 hypothetical protein BUL40_02930 [Croceivirga radicis]
MKHIYLLLLLLSCTLGFAQQSQANGDIPGFKLYPNPSLNGKVYIETAQNAPKEIIIFDVLGTQVLRTTILGNELNVSDLDKGVYILRAIEQKKTVTRKLVVK